MALTRVRPALEQLLSAKGLDVMHARGLIGACRMLGQDALAKAVEHGFTTAVDLMVADGEVPTAGHLCSACTLGGEHGPSLVEVLLKGNVDPNSTTAVKPPFTAVRQLATAHHCHPLCAALPAVAAHHCQPVCAALAAVVSHTSSRRPLRSRHGPRCAAHAADEQGAVGCARH